MAVKKGTIAGAGILALLLASGGGAWLSQHKDPTIEEIQAACAKHELRGIVCQTDLLKTDDFLSSGEANAP